jgi:hypothetical protein
MSAIANIVAYDGAGTPVIHTFIPVSVTREKGSVIALYRENLSGVPLDGQPTIELRIDELNSGIRKAVATVSLPVMESVLNQNAAGYTAAPKVAYVVKGSFTLFVHPRSSGQNRTDVRTIMANILRSITTSVAAVTTGPVPELTDGLYAPT